MTESKRQHTAEQSEDRAPEETWSVRKLIAWTADYLKRNGSETPRLDAEVMLAFALGCERVELYTDIDKEVETPIRNRYRELVKRRSRGAPVAYLVGRKEFFSLPFDVSPAVLIPRPESEFVVVEFLECTRDRGSVRAVDVGTGSGCLAIAAAHQNPQAQFIAVDRSNSALAVAAANAKKHGVAERIEFREGDLLEPIAAEAPFDVILSNPPYIPSAEIEHLAPCVRDFEPRGALDGGPSGLAIVERLIEQAIPLLKTEGHLILEIGHNQEKAVRALLDRPEFRLNPTIRDLALHPRVVHARRT